MSETKSYKNINLSDLGTKQKIVQVASRVALFVPRLLGKLATKLIVNPITKLTTGQTYEDVRNAAVDIVMEAQREEASKLDEKIEVGYQNLEDWQEDTEYFISNLGKYKSYQSTIEDLEKKQTRLLTSPKKLLIGKAYLSVMKKRREERKEQKQVRKMVQQVVSDYMLKKQSIKDKELEIEALENALKTARGELTNMNQDLQQFTADNAEIINQINNDREYVEVKEDETVVTPEEVSVEPQADAPTTEESVVEEAAEISEEVSVESRVDASTTEEPVVEEPMVTPDVNEVYHGKYLRNEGPAVEQQKVETTKNGEQPLSYEELQGVMGGVPIPASPEEQALFNQMANMATLGQVPTPDTSNLEAYGLSEGEKHKQM